jgi:hypothetical protein
MVDDLAINIMQHIIYVMVGKSRGNKQVDKNAAKEKSTDSKKSKKMVKARENLGGGKSRPGLGINIWPQAPQETQEYP